MKKKLILLTNDDGMFAPGLKASVEVMKKFGEVIVVAPDKPQSGQGHAITLNDPLRMNKVSVFEGVEAYETNGTPADCVKLAKHVLLKNRKVDLCVSGINHGSNASINVLYSGTMSAAMEASLEGINSIGISLLDFSFEADFTATKSYLELLATKILNNGFEMGKLINVNVPKLPLSEIKGIKLCTQAKGRWVEEFQDGIDPTGKPYYWLTGKFIHEGGYGDDITALKNGYVSVVPVMHDLTNYKALKELKL